MTWSIMLGHERTSRSIANQPWKLYSSPDKNKCFRLIFLPRWQSLHIVLTFPLRRGKFGVSCSIRPKRPLSMKRSFALCPAFLYFFFLSLSILYSLFSLLHQIVNSGYFGKYVLTPRGQISIFMLTHSVWNAVRRARITSSESSVSNSLSTPDPTS